MDDGPAVGRAPARRGGAGATAMGSVISVGSVNVDLQMRVPEGLSGTVLASELLRAPGGKAANVAVFTSRLGAGARLVACVGRDDLAALALEGPCDNGVDVEAVFSAPPHTGTSVILVDAGGGKRIVLALGANDAWAEHAGEVERMTGEAGAGAGAGAGAVVVVDLEIPVAVARAAMDGARRAGRQVVLDPAPADRVAPELLAGVDHVTPDHHEAGRITGIEVDSEPAARRAARALCERGAGNAYVKLASGGCAMATADGRTEVVGSPDDLEVVDTTGAGDAFAGALAWALLDGRPAAEAGFVAVAGSCCATTAWGSQASYPTLEALLAMTERVRAASERGGPASGGGG